MKKSKKKSTGYPPYEPVVYVLDGEASAGEALTEAYRTHPMPQPGEQLDK